MPTQMKGTSILHCRLFQSKRETDRKESDIERDGRRHRWRKTRSRRDVSVWRRKKIYVCMNKKWWLLKAGQEGGNVICVCACICIQSTENGSHIGSQIRRLMGWISIKQKDIQRMPSSAKANTVGNNFLKSETGVPNSLGYFFACAPPFHQVWWYSTKHFSATLQTVNQTDNTGFRSPAHSLHIRKRTKSLVQKRREKPMSRCCNPIYFLMASKGQH